MNQTIKAVIFWAVIVVSAILLWQVVRAGSQGGPIPEISYSGFLARLASGDVSKVTIAGNVVRGYGNKSGTFRVVVPSNQAEMLAALHQHGVEIWFKEVPEQNWPNWILNLAPLVLLAALWFFMIRQMQSRSRAQQGKSSADPVQGAQPHFGP